MILKLVVELKDVKPSDVSVFKGLSTDTMTVIVQTTDSCARITAKGSYDELVNVILTATCFKNYQVHLY